MSTVSLSPESGAGYGFVVGAGVRGSRRRTVSTSFEQNDAIHRRLVLGDNRKTVSYADNMISATGQILEKSASIPEDVPQKKLRFLDRIPCLGIILVIVGVTVFQGGSVLAKKMTIHPFMMVFYSDTFKLFFTTPFTIHGGENPFPRGKLKLIFIRGTAAGLNLMVHFYAVRYLPMSDVTMIASIKPVTNTLLACIFLKEACGLFEVMNLLLVTSGIFLVVQPSIVFGNTSQQYDNHMMYTAIALFITNAICGVIGVILRYLRDMHWAALAISNRFFTVTEMIIVCSSMGLFCFPDCDSMDRWGVIILAVVGNITQMLFIFSLKCEEAHVIGLTDNAASIIISFLFQILFFQVYPNTLKIGGACIVIFSILLLGGHKIWKSRQNKL